MPSLRLSRSAFARVLFAALGLAGVFAAVGPSHADEAPACRLTLEQLRAFGAKSRAEDGASYVEYAGADAARILAAVNAVFPTSDYVDELVVVVARGDEVRVGLVHAGCVDHALMPPKDAWDALVDHALGDRS